MDKRVVEIVAEIEQRCAELRRILTPQPGTWSFPVGSDKFPIADWYCAQYHTYDKDIRPDGHTGLDLNGDRAPWGDVDRDEPVFAIADGVVHDVGYSSGWGGVVVIKVEHKGAPLYVRYGHLTSAGVLVPLPSPGDAVHSGQQLGNLGNYSRGDHLHLDAAFDPFNWYEYRIDTVRWVDPLPTLREHLDNDMIDEMLARRSA